jgi:hypothetical protein
VVAVALLVKFLMVAAVAVVLEVIEQAQHL